MLRLVDLAALEVVDVACGLDDFAVDADDAGRLAVDGERCILGTAARACGEVSAEALNLSGSRDSQNLVACGYELVAYGNILRALWKE